MMPLVSIIMPYYRKKDFVKKSIQSIITQNFKNFEIIIVNDELSIESFKILKTIKSLDKRIKILNNKANSGAGISRNRGIKFSKGKYIAFCDCDDLWKKKKLLYQLKFMKKFNIEFCYTDYKVINNIGTKIGIRKAQNKMSFNQLVRSCDIGMSSVILKKNIFKRFKVYFPNTKTKEDYILWLKLAKKGIKMHRLNKELSSWRKLDNSLSSSSIQKIIDGYKVYRKYLKYNIFKSYMCLFTLSLNYLLKK